MLTTLVMFIFPVEHIAFEEFLVFLTYIILLSSVHVANLSSMLMMMMM
jgi:hypothetical protein